MGLNGRTSCTCKNYWKVALCSHIILYDSEVRQIPERNVTQLCTGLALRKNLVSPMGQMHVLGSGGQQGQVGLLAWTWVSQAKRPRMARPALQRQELTPNQHGNVVATRRHGKAGKGGADDGTPHLTLTANESLDMVSPVAGQVASPSLLLSPAGEAGVATAAIAEPTATLATIDETETSDYPYDSEVNSDSDSGTCSS